MRWVMAMMVGSVLVGAADGKPVTAMSVCLKLEQAGVAAGCREDKPAGLGAAATEKAAFDLPSVPGKTGQVLRFETDNAYQRTFTAFENVAMMAGPHRYGSARARIFVQLNERASLAVGKKARAIVEAL